jgi:hypothetical protein
LNRKPPDSREAAKRAALNALRRARRSAERSGIALSDWEGEFLGSVEERLNTFGRAFGDPEKGAPGASLSVLQGVKLKEISAKAQGKTKAKGLRRGRILGPTGREDKNVEDAD